MATHTHPTLGPFTHDPDVDWWSGHMTWQGRPIPLHLDSARETALPALFETALALQRDDVAWHERLRRFAAEDLLETYNDAWADGQTLTLDGLASGLSPKSIVVRENDDFDFIFTAGDLFGGHDVAVIANLSSGPSSTDLQG